MLQLPPPLQDRCPAPSVTPWSPSRVSSLGCGTMVLGGPVTGGYTGDHRIRPERSNNRKNVQKLTWRNSPWIRGYSESDRVRSMTITDVSPTVAIRRVILLYENQQYREAANFINRLHLSTFKSILEDLPVDMFVDAMPQSLPILEALYGKVFLADGLNFPLKLLKPESVVMQMARIFSNKELFEACFGNNYSPILLSCKKLIKVIVLSEPRIRKQMTSRKRALEKAIEGMGQHGLVGTSDRTLMNLHEALKVEFERAIHQYKTAVQKLDELSLAPKQLVTRSLSYGPAPTKASHQRQLSLRQGEVQERLIKNKSLLNVIEPTLTDHSLDLLLRILRKRVEFDKDVLFQFTQLKKEVKEVNPGSVVAPVLMRYIKGCGRVLDLMRELGEDDMADSSSSDISGYHSDSDSAIASGSFKTGGCRRYNLMYRSVRVSSRGSSGGSSSDNRSLEDNRSARNKHRNGIRNNNENILRPSRNGKSNSPTSCGDHPSPIPQSKNPSCDAFWEIGSLQKKIDSLREELGRAQNTIVLLEEREKKLKDRLSEQAQKMLERGVKFENVSLGERRPSSLVRRYGNLYAQARVDTLDALDTLDQLKEADELKSKILFSVVVLAFRSVQTTLMDIKCRIRCALQIPEFPERDPVANELQNGVDAYLRRTVETFDLSKNDTEVFSQICATLYDYPCLKNCSGLVSYVRDCVRLAWALTNQNPSYLIEYETRSFRRDMHVRFHTSSQESDIIKTYLWPSLVEGENGPCVHKGVVVT